MALDKNGLIPFLAEVHVGTPRCFPTVNIRLRSGPTLLTERWRTTFKMYLRCTMVKIDETFPAKHHRSRLYDQQQDRNS